MQFIEEVQEQFRQAGWYPGRNVQKKFDKVKGLGSFPDFLKEFLYEYGDLHVLCLDPDNMGFNGSFNLKALTSSYFKVNQYLSKPQWYGINLFTFPIAEYPSESAPIECDAEGRVYVAGEFPCMISETFKEGIERIILEDYSHSLKWEEGSNAWDKPIKNY